MKQKRNNDPQECPICRKPFPCGKAMGGHMRAHFVTHTFPPATMINKNALKNLVASIYKQVGENLMLNSSVKIESSSQWKSLTRTRSWCRPRFMAAEAKVEAEEKEAEEEQQESSIPDPDTEHAAETLIDKPSTSGANKSDKPSAPKLRPCLDLNLPPSETDEEVTSMEDL